MEKNKEPGKFGATKNSLFEDAYERIYHKIVSLEYLPGMHLQEKQVVAQLGIGRTPVRQALLRLACESILELQTNKGFFVKEITLQNTKAVFESLKILELGISTLAVKENTNPYLSLMRKANKALEDAKKRRDVLGLVESNHEFHIHFAYCSNNPYLIRAIKQVRCETNRLGYLYYTNPINSIKKLDVHYNSVIQQHREIITCIEMKNQVRLQELVSDHILIFQERTISYLISYREPPSEVNA